VVHQTPTGDVMYPWMTGTKIAMSPFDSCVAA
jgi:hypothetical protein